MSLGAPYALLALPALLAALAAWLAVRRRRAPPPEPYPDLDLVVAAGRPRARRWLPLGLAVAGVLLLGAALARPHLPDGSGAATAPPTVMLVIDTSTSMNAVDVPPNRLAAAEAAALAFGRHVPRASPVGLVSFASTPSVLLTPTTNRDLLRHAVRGLQALGATAIGDGVLAALSTLEAVRRGDPRGLSDTAILLLSDGQNVTGASPDQAAAAARAQGVPVHTVALSAGAGAPPSSALDPGGLVQLKRLADRTGGHALEAHDPRALTAAFAGLGTLVGNERRPGSDLTVLLAGLALALLLAAGLTSRRLGPGARRRLA